MTISLVGIRPERLSVLKFSASEAHIEIEVTVAVGCIRGKDLSIVK